ncbi:MAG: hypothetical protein WA728_22775 [Xanthobacteraceae bacterium]
MTTTDNPRPFLADTDEARRLLGNVGKNRFWKLIAPKLQSIGNERKRWWVVSSIEAYVVNEANKEKQQ